MTMVKNKPFIQRSPDYDGPGWSCYGQGPCAGRGTGKTPAEAYENWKIDNEFETSAEEIERKRNEEAFFLSAHPVAAEFLKAFR